MRKHKRRAERSMARRSMYIGGSRPVPFGWIHGIERRPGAAFEFTPIWLEAPLHVITVDLTISV